MKTPWNPSKKATARVTDPLPVPEVCQFCTAAVEIVENSAIYGKNYGEWPWAYRCKGCGAYVGMHPFTNIPLGTLADSATREARKKLKDLFNPLWQSGKMSRSEAYAWLAEKLGIEKASCHVGWFGLEMCNRAINLLREQREMW